MTVFWSNLLHRHQGPLFPYFSFPGLWWFLVLGTQVTVSSHSVLVASILERTNNKAGFGCLVWLSHQCLMVYLSYKNVLQTSLLWLWSNTWEDAIGRKGSFFGSWLMGSPPCRKKASQKHYLQVGQQLIHKQLEKEKKRLEPEWVWAHTPSLSDALPPGKPHLLRFCSAHKQHHKQRTKCLNTLTSGKHLMYKL